MGEKQHQPSQTNQTKKNVFSALSSNTTNKYPIYSIQMFVFFTVQINKRIYNISIQFDYHKSVGAQIGNANENNTAKKSTEIV